MLNCCNSLLFNNIGRLCDFVHNYLCCLILVCRLARFVRVFHVHIQCHDLVVVPKETIRYQSRFHTFVVMSSSSHYLRRGVSLDSMPTPHSLTVDRFTWLMTMFLHLVQVVGASEHVDNARTLVDQIQKHQSLFWRFNNSKR